MRIYSTKTYIIWPNDSEVIPLRVDGQKLRDMVKGATLAEGDIVYEATIFARTKEKRSVVLVDAEGTPVEGVENEGESAGLPPAGG